MFELVDTASHRTPAKAPWTLLLWTAVASLVFGLIGFGELAEDWLRVARNSFRPHAASGQVVVVKIDDRALKEHGNWPWPRRLEAQMIDRLEQAGAKAIFLDINFSFPSAAADDRALAQAIERSGKVTILARSKIGPIGHDKAIDARPLPAFTRNARIASGSVHYNYQNAVWQMPFATMMGKDRVPSFGAALAGVDGPAEAMFPIDYSLDVTTVPAFSASDLLAGKLGARQFAGRKVIVGTASDILGDTYFIPGYGRNYGIFVHSAAAETLIRGRSQYFGWMPGALAALVVIALALLCRRTTHTALVLTGGAVILTMVPIALELKLLFFDITPGLFAFAIVGGALVWRRFHARGLVNPSSGLPNLSALTAFRAGRRQAIVAARMLNFEEALASLPPHSERKLVEQVIARLGVGNRERVIFQGDGGIFAWFAEPREPFGNHLEALQALFRNPARVADLSVDLSVNFGVELGSSRSLASRLASALVAADEAARDGLKWKIHDPETLQDASWRLSMLSQLDAAIDKGEVWVAYQPKLDLASRRIVGCEALARWTHPEKGPIAASEFVAAAEQSNRIGKLTDFVLSQAVANAAALVKRAGGEFDMAVNMSASLLSDKSFVLRLSALLARHGLAARHLTLELTETAALTSSGEGLDMIGQLRNLGVGISIDDYGTGLSTLDYLKRVPANEIKIDQSFVKGIAESRSDRLMVQSTIQLAHSLGHRVVAEGAELREIVDILTEMKCDFAQGYAIGRPMSIESLAKRISADRKRSAA
ncbi:MAG: EAL domain-containing protein [Sphingomicrobium sp.]